METGRLEELEAYTRIRPQGFVMNSSETQQILLNIDPEYVFPADRPTVPDDIQNLLDQPASYLPGSDGPTTPPWDDHTSSSHTEEIESLRNDLRNFDLNEDLQECIHTDVFNCPE
jgi:hypothetical protein